MSGKVSYKAYQKITVKCNYVECPEPYLNFHRLNLELLKAGYRMQV